jgi:hypothetical protein
LNACTWFDFAAASLDADDRSVAQSGLLPLMDDLAYRYYLSADGTVFVRDALVPEDGLPPVTDAAQRLTVYRIAVSERPPPAPR